jgi:hypothetical protein
MQDNGNSELSATKRMPWNKGKLIGTKPPIPDIHRKNYRENQASI